MKKQWLPAGLGATPRTLAILGGVVVIGIPLVLWMNSGSNTPAAQTASAPAPAPVISIPAVPKRTQDVPLPMPPKRTGTREIGRIDEFRPTLKPKEGVDLTRIDPTLKLGLLAKVQQVPLEGGSRSLFEFYTPPPPPPPKVDPIKPAPPPPPAAAKEPEAAKPSAPPPPPPISLKYYGYAGTTANGALKACFLDGDPATGEIYVAAENELVKNRYKIIRIGVKSAVVEDTSNKNQQTLPLVTEEGG